MLQLSLMHGHLFEELFDYERGSLNFEAIYQYLESLEYEMGYSTEYVQLLRELLVVDCHQRADFLTMRKTIFQLLKC